MAWLSTVLLLCAAGLATLVEGDCKCSGLDYTNGGAYYIDQNSNNNFTFTSVFDGEE
jgi:hypothetical protein